MSEHYQLVDNQGQLSACADALIEAAQKAKDAGKQPRLYLDTEFESNRSGTRMCLLQVSAGSTAYLLDPLRLKSLNGLKASFEEAEWILHAGLQDVALIGEAVGAHRPKRLLDTQVAWALCSPEAGVSLSYLKYRLLGERGSKAHQADDWVRRPLQASQLRYAAADVLGLPEMTDILLDHAARLGRTEIVFEASLDALRPKKEPPPPLSLSSFRNAWQLDPNSQAALRFIMDWFNGLPPEQRRHAPETKALLSVASRCPRNRGELARIKGVPRTTVERFGDDLLEGIRRATSEAKNEDFVALEPPPYATYEEIRLDAWLGEVRAELSTKLEFSPEFVLPKRLLGRMKAALLVEGAEGLFESLVGWRRSLLEEALREFCERSPAPV